MSYDPVALWPCGPVAVAVANVSASALYLSNLPNADLGATASVATRFFAATADSCLHNAFDRIGLFLF